jgi:CelD/BcsL family acetyltransferase involved in cellulose biosynthesis
MPPESSNGNWRSTRNRANKQFSDPAFTIQKCHNEHDRINMLQEFYRLHHKRWHYADKPGSFAKHPGLEDFYNEFTKVALENGWLQLYALSYNDETIAVQLGYTFDHSYYQIQEGFDIERFSGSGNYLREQIIKQCIDENIQYYDFLGGDSEHKQRWGAEKREGFDLFIYPKKLNTLAFRFTEVWPSGKYLKPKQP